MNQLSIVLFNPEIPQNTGNIIRLTANIGATLYLVEPIGFDLDNKKLKRAHLYYDEFANIVIFKDWESCKNHFRGRRMIGIETGGSNNVFNKNFLFNDVFVFGSESSGLPQYVMDDLEILSIPMCKGSRSLNLANCASIVLYEAWRQFDFVGSIDLGNMGYNFANGL